MAYNIQPLVSLLQDIIYQSPKHLNIDDKSQIKILLEKATYLNQIIGYSCTPSSAIAREGIASEITDATHKAEEIIESFIADQVLANQGNESLLISVPDLQHVIDVFDSASERVRAIMSGTCPDFSEENVVGVSSFREYALSIPNGTLVGREQELETLKYYLTNPNNHNSRLSTITIAGMGGIGKTALAQALYDDPVIHNHFEIRAWVTIPRSYDVRAILLTFLGCVVGEVTDEILSAGKDKLIEILHSHLNDKRFLIVMDNVWERQIWVDVTNWLPSCTSESRILITTRKVSLSKRVSDLKFQILLLNDFNSWKLLCTMIFFEETCPANLEKIGKTIARKCHGLPLTIYTIGKLLSESPKEKAIWEKVAMDVVSAAAQYDEKLSEVLGYDDLYSCLRPCLLYVASFPEGYKINAFKLINLWVAEGLLTRVANHMENAARRNLNRLIDISLIFHEQECYTDVERYNMHSLFRGLCNRLSGQENFIHVKKANVLEGDSSHSIHRVVLHPRQDFAESENLTQVARSFICSDYSAHLFNPLVFGKSRLLRVLDVLEIAFRQFPEEILQLVNIHYLALTCYSDLPHAISRLWKLQTLIFRQDSDSRANVPSTIWNLAQLRHFKFKNSYCWVECGSEHVVLEWVQTLCYVDASLFTKPNFVKRIPNIRTLGFRADMLQKEDVIDLSPLYELETLKICNMLGPSESFKFLGLKKLTLSECTISASFIANVGSLRFLYVLKIRKCNFVNQDTELMVAEWKIGYEQFFNLKFLLLEEVNLVRVLMDENCSKCLARLERLVIRYCHTLEEIPIRIGDVPTLQSINMDGWSLPAVSSARQIEERQRRRGNVYFHVRVHGLWK